MKFFLSLIAMSFAFLTTASAMPRELRHLDLEMTGQEYQALLKQNKKAHSPIKSIEAKVSDPEDAVLDKYLLLGQKNLAWVDLVNSQRTAQNKISLSSAATQQGYPISAPRSMNFAIVLESWQILEAVLPSTLRDVIFNNAPITPNLTVTDREFTEWLWQVDRAYQLTARYKMMKPWRSEMASVAAYDVRGYLQLLKATDLDQKLNDWTSLSPSLQSILITSLTQICRNAQLTKAECAQELQSAVANNTLVDFKNNYMEPAKLNYDGFFIIPKTRTDVTWISPDKNNLSIPFANPHNQTVQDFLKYNIEDEFRWLGWQLHLDFVETKSLDTTHVVFEVGATPHVNDIAGSEITMDANSLLSEYDVQWTIRHEYGHVLGFPDCYIEFYDEDADVIMSYQLDITNLMCSRRGHFKQTHFDELERVYLK